MSIQCAKCRQHPEIVVASTIGRQTPVEPSSVTLGAELDCAHWLYELAKVDGSVDVPHWFINTEGEPNV